jgi:hypothetical protein
LGPRRPARYRPRSNRSQAAVIAWRPIKVWSLRWERQPGSCWQLIAARARFASHFVVFDAPCGAHRSHSACAYRQSPESASSKLLLGSARSAMVGSAAGRHRTGRTCGPTRRMHSPRSRSGEDTRRGVLNCSLMLPSGGIVNVRLVRLPWTVNSQRHLRLKETTGPGPPLVIGRSVVQPGQSSPNKLDLVQR